MRIVPLKKNVDGSRSDIDELMGMAVGCMGMSYDDFCRCTPCEFKCVFDAWQRHHELMRQEDRERVRMMCLCMLQPYSKRRLKASDVMSFPWERAAVKAERVTDEELMERYKAAKARWGLR